MMYNVAKAVINKGSTPNFLACITDAKAITSGTIPA